MTEVISVSYRRRGRQPPPRAVLEIGPTIEFLRHHDVRKPEIGPKTYHPQWCVTSRFMALKPENPTAEEKERWLDIEAAAVWWRTAWDIGVELVREGRPTERVDCQVSPAGITDAQADAKALLRACAAALGRDLARVVEWCLGLDMPWHVMGGYLGCDYRTAQDVARLALDALAVYHREISVSGRQRFSA